MDLLASLGLENSLPEQSTRLSHPGVISALEKSNNDSSEECQLGFNCCLTCGASLLVLLPSDNNDDGDGKSIDNNKAKKKKKRGVIINCKGCNRVKYCSEVCRRVDAEPQQLLNNGGGDDDDDDVDEGALGHSPVICSLLNLCNDDETAEDNLYNNPTKTKPIQQNNTIQKEEAAKYRVQTERESYPATLFNMLLSDGPPWLIESLTRRLRYKEEVRSPDVKKGGGSGSGSGERKKRRGKRDRQSLSQEEEESTITTTKSGGGLHSTRELVLHIVGASVDSELWGWDGTTTSYTHDEMLDAYAEASTNVLSYLKNFIDSIETIRLVFVGPDCPKPRSGGGDGDGDDETMVCRLTKSIPGSSKTILHIETHCCNYGEEENATTSSFPDPDAIIFFNPGLSCPDYDWSKALSTASSYPSSPSTPFLITTNTEMEGFADIKCLVDGGYVALNELPMYVLETVGVETTSSNNNSSYNEEEDDEQNNKKFFFCENPYAGLRVRQSGTMANDLYVKSRWVMGGLFQRGGDDVDETKSKKKKMVDKSKKKKRNKDSDERGSARNKKRRKGGSNPALI